jgi:hypothetical protein
MDLVRKSSGLLTGATCLMLLACASPPAAPLTPEQIHANRERATARAVGAAAAAGEDPLMVYERLNFNGLSR